MSEVITIEAVSDKFKNKYNSGSIMAGGKWMQVSSKLDLNSFKKDKQMTVETKTNDKGYTSIVGIVEDSVTDEVEDVIKATKPARTTKSKETDKPSYEDTKNRRILVQGITQACLASPALAALPYTTVEELAKNAQNLAIEMIEFVDQESSK